MEDCGKDRRSACVKITGGGFQTWHAAPQDVWHAWKATGARYCFWLVDSQRFPFSYVPSLLNLNMDNILMEYVATKIGMWRLME